MPFEAGNPGRPKGTPNKTTQDVKQALELAFEGAGGVPALIAFARAKPESFYPLYAKLLPRDVKLGTEGKLIIEIVRK